MKKYYKIMMIPSGWKVLQKEDKQLYERVNNKRIKTLKEFKSIAYKILQVVYVEIACHEFFSR